MADRFYVPDLPLCAGTIVELSDEESHHLLRVMRARPGQPLRLFGDGREFSAVLHEIRGRSARALLQEVIVPPPPPAFRMIFLLPWLKGGRTEEVLQKLTELGAAAAVIYSARREVAKLDPAKLDRLRRSVLEASKQCERADPPTVDWAPELSAGLARHSLPRQRCLILAERATTGPTLSSMICQLKNSVPPEGENLPVASRFGAVLLASGPEGGFHPDELAACDHTTVRVTLGPRILRAETAPLAAAAAVLAVGGDL